MNNNERIYSVSALCRETRLLLEGHFMTLNLEGEISNLARPASGHLYFTIKDDKAQIQCAMFRPKIRQINFKPTNGCHVIVKARVSLYEPRGSFQLIAEHMELAGEGLLKQQFEALKNKLFLEGLYDQAEKKPLPTIAKKVGVISSASGAAVHDILSVLNTRFPSLPVLIYPVNVQGPLSKNDIVQAIELANQRQDCDVLILTRGGGSIEDLWSFNEEIVARAIYRSNIPIISAVGHEVDTTIADFVADHRAPTPSAAAEKVSPDQQQWIKQTHILADKLSRQLLSTLNEYQQQLTHLQQRLKQAHPGLVLQINAQRLDECINRLIKAPKHRHQHEQLALSQLNTRLLQKNPRQFLNNYQQHFSSHQHRLFTTIQKKIHHTQIRFANYATALETLNPLATLSRGYSITKRKTDNKIIYSTRQVNLGDTLVIQLQDGHLKTTLDQINENT